MRIAHIVPCRDKEKHVAKTVLSVLDQTLPCHVVLSDQGSTDKSFEILLALKSHYRGPHKVSVLRCPDTEPKGMRGMNAHLDWIMSQIDEDVILITSADDLAYPDRNEKVAKAFSEKKPDMVLTALHFVEPDMKIYGVTARPKEDGFVTPKECLEGLVGGSTAHAWTRDFYNAVGGFGGICGFDAFWPFLATVRNGAYFIREELHAYVRHADPNNTGLEGVRRAADASGQLQIDELMSFQVTSAYLAANSVMDQWGIEDQEARFTLYNEILSRTAGWSDVRTQMTLKGIPPLPLKA
jgi:glycosyltransferase involved in cell wall biosynthesis